MQDILSQIVADKRVEVREANSRVSEAAVRDEALAVSRPPLSMATALAGSGCGIIAEFKRRSPSKGWIHEDADFRKVIPEYAAAGAAALSVLTDGKYFGGSLSYIREIRPLVDIPILRKDFIISEYQLYEARAAGADAVLLIAACLSREDCLGLIEKAHSLGLEVLLEIHSEAELDYVCPQADMVGVNNRNLGTFHTDVANSFRIASALRLRAVECGCPVLVSESGISEPQTVLKLREAGFKGFLMGENFMKRPQPGETLRDFVRCLSDTSVADSLKSPGASSKTDGAASGGTSPCGFSANADVASACCGSANSDGDFPCRYPDNSGAVSVCRSSDNSEGCGTAAVEASGEIRSAAQRGACCKDRNNC